MGPVDTLSLLFAVLQSQVFIESNDDNELTSKVT